MNGPELSDERSIPWHERASRANAVTRAEGDD